MILGLLETSLLPSLCTMVEKASRHSHSSDEKVDQVAHNEYVVHIMTPEERQAALDAAIKIDPGPPAFSLAAFQVRCLLPFFGTRFVDCIPHSST